MITINVFFTRMEPSTENSIDYTLITDDSLL
jgi:hypothetical protein